MRLSYAAAAVPDDLSTVDLADPRLYEQGEPHAVWRALRERDPVHRQPVPGRGSFWAITRYADAQQVMLDHDTFSSTSGVFLNLLGRAEPARGQQFASSDPPRHTQLRAPMQHRVSAAGAARHLADMRGEIRAMLDVGLGGGTFDLIEAFAPLPMVALGPLLGIPPADWPALLRLAMMSVAEEDPDYMLPAGPEATLERAHRELFGYLTDLVVRRLRQPRDDLIGIMSGLRTDDGPLRPGAIVANAYSIVLGAAAAIPHVPAAAMRELARADLYGRLADRPDALETLVEEALRWATPAQHFMRVATRAVRVGGVLVEPGDAVVVWLGSANRDVAAFESPDEFDPWRSPNRHLAFGAGRHYCFGNHFARLALRILFAEMFARYAAIEPSGAPTHVRSTWLAGFKRFPVTVTPR
ncbi:cytochrome P450 [Micromonospora zhanjiangensis]|uniref:Cytochrome P450 n=1 Tax=Micromonospora zhanjiangensis TaxID=1522057 RepID=A0ABV8KPT2_9ACTN